MWVFWLSSLCHSQDDLPIVYWVPIFFRQWMTTTSCNFAPPCRLDDDCFKRIQYTHLDNIQDQKYSNNLCSYAMHHHPKFATFCVGFFAAPKYPVPNVSQDDAVGIPVACVQLIQLLKPGNPSAAQGIAVLKCICCMWFLCESLRQHLEHLVIRYIHIVHIFSFMTFIDNHTNTPLCSTTLSESYTHQLQVVYIYIECGVYSMHIIPSQTCSDVLPNSKR